MLGHGSSQKLEDSSCQNNSKTALRKAGMYEDTLYIYINFIWINYCSCYNYIDQVINNLF